MTCAVTHSANDVECRQLLQSERCHLSHMRCACILKVTCACILDISKNRCAMLHFDQENGDILMINYLTTMLVVCTTKEHFNVEANLNQASSLWYGSTCPNLSNLRIRSQLIGSYCMCVCLRFSSAVVLLGVSHVVQLKLHQCLCLLLTMHRFAATS